MKFIKIKFKVAIVICIILLELNNSFFLENKIKGKIKINLVSLNNENEMEGDGFREFVTEANGHMKEEKGSCGNISQCRPMNEVLYVAYSKSKALKTLLNVDKVYIAQVVPNLNIDGVNRLIISVPGLVGDASSDKKGAPLLKICVPTDRTKSSYVNASCPLMDCPPTSAQAELCMDDPNVPLQLPFRK